MIGELLAAIGLSLWPTEPGNWRYCYFDDDAQRMGYWDLPVTTERDTEGDLMVVTWNAADQTPVMVHRTHRGYMVDGLSGAASGYWAYPGLWVRR